jgi:hypothetical protein
LRALDPGVLSVSTRIVRRLAEAAVEELRARYDFGAVVHTLRYGDADSCRAETIRDLADWIGADPSALRRWARVNERMRAEEFETYLELRTPRGMPLTWTHLEVLARERNRGRRGELAVVAARGGLSVRELAPLMAQGRKRS